MYFVTTKRPGYVLFSMTPSERLAVGVTDDQRRVQILARDGAGWRVHQEWPLEALSHTEIMTRLGAVDEPSTVDALVQLATGR